MKLFDWLANAKSVNDEVNADAVRIAALELALRQANIKAMVWQVKAEDLQDKMEEARNTIAVSDAQYEGAQAALKAARSEIEELEANEETNWPLISYALKRKKSLADYDAKRRGRA